VRILHVNKFLYRKGGAEGYMEDLAALQEEAGHTVEYWGMEHPENTHLGLDGTLAPFMELEHPPGGLPDRARMVGRMVWNRRAEQGMAEAIRRFRPDVAHLHNVYHQLSPSILKPLAGAGVPVVLTLHDYKLVCPTYQFLDQGEICTRCVGRRFWNAPLTRCRDGSLLASTTMALDISIHTLLRSYGRVDAFICPSGFLAGQMAAGKVFPDRLHVIRHFVDLAGVAPKPQPGGHVVLAGRLSHEKGADVAVRAMARLGDGAHLHIAGDGPDRAALEALAAREAPGRVTFHGRLTRHRLLDLLRESSVAVVPSVWHENQPMAVLEALAVGLPVVGTELGGVPELVAPGVDGELVPHGDPDALAAALGPLLADPDRAFAMGRAGRAKIEREFPPALHLERVHGLYQTIGVSGAEGSRTS
jgi:glycosyltransferase involved in cell wall biosynthesis